MKTLAAACAILALAGCAAPKGGDGSLLGEPADVWVPRLLNYSAQCGHPMDPSTGLSFLPENEFPTFENCLREKEQAHQAGRADRPHQQFTSHKIGDGSLLGESADVWVPRIFNHSAACGYPVDPSTGLSTAPESALPALENCIRERERAYQAGRGHQIAWTRSYYDTPASRGYRQPALGVYCVEC